MSVRVEPVPGERSGELLLARRAAAGDEVAFEQLYREHSARVFALCLRLSGSRLRATELTQDVFVHVWGRLASWRGESALSSWIYRLTVNLVISNARDEQRRQKREVDLDAKISREPDHHDASAGAAPRLRVETAARRDDIESAIDLERAIAELPAGARTVFVLHDIEGYQHSEIAEMTGTAEGTCRAQLHRARRLLMEALSA
jgi:RNA polymerase sigma-70 factor (ECF subfamily)